MAKKTEKEKSLTVGTVVSDKMDKTAVVAVNTLKTHRKYLKKYLVTKKYKAHDPQNKCQTGDRVQIVETRPISKGKKWAVVYNEQKTTTNE